VAHTSLLLFLGVILCLECAPRWNSDPMVLHGGRAKNAKRRFGRLLVDRRSLATPIFLAFVIALAWAVSKSFEEENVDVFLNPPRPLFEPKSYRVVVDSFDGVSGKVHVRAQVVFEKDSLWWNSNTQTLFKDSEAVKKGKVFFGPLAVDDLGRYFDALGLLAVQREIPQPARPDPSFAQTPPGDLETDAVALGNPKLYPFDKYLVLARVSCPAWATLDGKNFIKVPGGHYTLSLKAAGFLMQRPSWQEVENWPTFHKQMLPQFARYYAGETKEQKQLREQMERYKPELWYENQFALLLERPSFLRFSTCFLGFVVLISLPYIVLHSKPSQFLVNSAGYFLSLWAVRQTLSAAAPTGHTLLDYSVMGLYVVFVAAMIARLTLGVRPPAAGPEASQNSDVSEKEGRDEG
jgi:hypothetical protein